MATVATPKPNAPLAPIYGKGGDINTLRPGGDGSPGGIQLPERRYTTGMMLALGAVTMLFAAFTSAYIVRRGLSDDWVSLSLPSILWGSSFVLLLSSLTIEMARRSFGELQRFKRWWLVTCALGIAFLAGQLLAWSQLARNGVYLATNPSSSFFYLLTAAHGVHLVGGILALLAIALRAWLAPPGPGPTSVGVTALYWHFMDGLWIYLFAFLLIWR